MDKILVYIANIFFIKRSYYKQKNLEIILEYFRNDGFVFCNNLHLNFIV